jgi:hypothetical protein
MFKGATLPKFRKGFERRRAKIQHLTNHLMVQVHTAGLVANDIRHQELRGLITSTVSTSAGESPEVKLPIYFLQEMLRNNQFFGRKEELATIERMLQGDANRLSSVAVYGIGGCGKSTLALEYAYMKMNDYNVIAWLHADSKSKLEDQFSRFAIQCGLVEEGKSLDRVYETVLNWLVTSCKCKIGSSSLGAPLRHVPGFDFSSKLSGGCWSTTMRMMLMFWRHTGPSPVGDLS